MATGKSCSRWFAPLAALLMVVSLSGCFDKEGDQRKAFIDFLQNTVMRSGERLPTLTADQKKQFGPFVSDYANCVNAVYDRAQTGIHRLIHLLRITIQNRVIRDKRTKLFFLIGSQGW